MGSRKTHLRTLEPVIALIGYARVSTDDQDLAAQISALESAGCERIFSEHASGTRVDRLELDAALDYLRAGDVLVVWAIDRLSRSVLQLVNLLADLGARGVDFRSLTQPIDTTTAEGRFFLNVMGAFAELERDMISRRTKAGLAAAAARGAVGGRPTVLTADVLETIRSTLERAPSTTSATLARTLRISGASVSRGIKQLRDAGELPPSRRSESR
ncbi:recombinase family protein [Demequina sp.]|uniref:recombinase family protein n=1 Tax=Demequina sp. TaxID=2050685 RepID=UPI003D132590